MDSRDVDHALTEMVQSRISRGVRQAGRDGVRAMSATSRSDISASDRYPGAAGVLPAHGAACAKTNAGTGACSPTMQ